MRSVGHLERVQKMRYVVGKPQGKRPPGGPSHKWDGNIKIVFRIGVLRWGGWIKVTQDMAH